MMTTVSPERLSSDELLDWLPRILGTTADRLARLAASVPDAVLRRRPQSAEWSAYEVLHHLLDVERLVLPARIRAIVGGATTIVNVDQNAVAWDETRPAARIVADFAGLRAETMVLIAGLTPVDLGRTASHSAYGLVSLGQMLHYYPAHDLTHLIQIERAIMQPFLPGTGPWGAGVADMAMR